MQHSPVSRHPRSAIVLGGGLAGFLAAGALARHADVTIVERDLLPEGPEPRKGLPQARHVHLLWAGGALAIEELLPGTLGALRAQGGHYLPLPRDMVALSPRGWFRRWPPLHHMMLCSRDLLDATVRRQVLTAYGDSVTVLEGTTALGLLGGGAGVTGVRTVRDGVEEEHRADLVVDATGRGSRATVWLRELGFPEPPRREIDTGLVYATRMFEAPEGAGEGFPVVNVQADPRQGGPGRGGTLVPVEGGRWMVTLSGTRGGNPTADNEAFRPFALRLRHPVIGELIAGARPLGDVVLTRTTASRRVYHERARRRPDGFAVLGDALATYNPVYGHGMSVAAQSAVALRDTVARHGWGPGLARRVQRSVARCVRPAWDLAVGQDVFYPGAVPEGPTLRDRAVAAYVDRLMFASTGTVEVAHAVTRVTSLLRGSHTLLAPRVLLAALRGPRLPQLGGPPLTVEELAAAGVSRAAAGAADRR
ncbi:FAD-dependent monooxygenase [Streptomyces glaucosporus]|uniref:FAD-dependent monooxygenase n=1 Tax=Streptomyces glaucosporus TaxID=284044 RepID=A0ABP5W555_9ACTN